MSRPFTTLGAVVDHAHSDFIWRSIELDAPRDDEIVVEVSAVGICHTDLSARDGDMGVTFPALFGHEAAGVVRTVGSAVSTPAAGDRVVLSQAFCGQCRTCRQGNVTLCSKSVPLGMSGKRLDGSHTLHLESGEPLFGGFLGQSSFARHVIARAVNAVVVPDHVGWHILAPLGCGVQTGVGTVLNVLAPERGQSLAVYGLGTVGLSAICAAKAAGCDPIIAVDINPERRALAVELGATITLDPNTDVCPEAIRTRTRGGTDFTVEASGVPVAATAAMESLRAGGTGALVGSAPLGTHFSMDWRTLISGRTVTGVVYGGGHPAQVVPQLIEMYGRGVLPLDRLIRRYAFDDINTAVADMTAGRVIKPVLVRSGV